jgi:hypothetical protein
MPELPAIGRMKLDRIEEYFETIAAGRVYVGEGDAGEAEEAASPVLDSCEAATVVEV